MSIDKQQYRQILGHFATGVVAVTTRWQDRCFGMTVNSFTSVSLEPPLVLFCSKPYGQTPEAIEESGRFGINILACEQLEIAQRLAGMTKIQEADRFEGLDYRLSSSDLGIPWLPGCLAWLECRVEQRWQAGDHWVLLGRVLQMERGSSELDPLLFFKGQWPRLLP